MSDFGERLSRFKVVRWRLLELMEYYGGDEKVKIALDPAIAILDSAIAEVEVELSNKEV